MPRCEYCPVTPGLPCLGETHRPVCRDVAEGRPGRAAQLVALAEAAATPDGPDWVAGMVALAASPAGSVGPVDPAARDAVNACPYRGPEGGLALLDEERGCCGGGEERTLCRAGRGARPGRVTLRECLACRGAPIVNGP